MKLHKKNSISLIFFAFIFILIGCGTQDFTAYHEAVEGGLDALIAEQYEETMKYFEVAVTEAEKLEGTIETEKATQLLLQVQLFNEANQLLKDASFDEATAKAEEAANVENGSMALMKKSNELVTEIANVKANKAELQAAYEEAEAVIDGADLTGLKEGAVLLEAILNHELIEESYYLDIRLMSEDIYNQIQVILREQEAKIAQLDARDAEKRKVEEAAQVTAGSVNFDNLPLGLRIHLATTLVDERAYGSNLLGHYLNSKIEGNQLVVQVHSGVGTAHPYYLIEIGKNSITPKSGVVPTGVGIYSDAIVDTTPVSKDDLYEHYLAFKGDYDAGQIRVFQENPLFTLEYYNEMRSGIE